MSVSLEKVLKVVAGVRREIKEFYEKQEGKEELASALDGELDTYSHILFYLETCHDSDIAQNIAKQVLNRAKNLYAAIPKEAGANRLAVSGSLPTTSTTATPSSPSQQQQQQGTLSRRLTTIGSRSPRGVQPGTLSRAESAGSFFSGSPNVSSGSAEVLRPLAQSRPMDEASRKVALDACASKEERAIEKAHQEWDDEIVKLNKTIDEKVARMNARNAARRAGSAVAIGGGGGVSALSKTTEIPARVPQLRQPPQQTQQPQQTRVPQLSKPPALNSVKPPVSTTTATNDSSSPGSEKNRRSSLRNSASFVPLSPRSNAEASVFGEIQLASFMSKASTNAHQVGHLLKQSAVNLEILNATLRDMVLNAKSGADLIQPSMKSDKDALLDACRLVLSRASTYIAVGAENQQKKMELVAAVLTFVEVLNRIQTQIGSI